MNTEKLDKMEIIKEGDSLNFPTKGSKVNIHFKCYNSEFKLIEDTFVTGESLEFIIGQNEVIDGLDKILREMSIGEICKVKIPSNLAYKNKGLPGIIPKNSDLFFEIYLISFKS